MALPLTYNSGIPAVEQCKNSHKEIVKIRINRRKKPIVAEAYNGIYFNDDEQMFPKNKYRYYCRHSERDWDKLVSIKKSLGLTVNFWGTIVTDEPIDFNGKDEVSARIVWWQDGLEDNLNEE